jgi:hypothetical protein
MSREMLTKLSGNLKGRDHLKDVGVDGENNNETNLKKIGCGDVQCIELAQDVV